MFPYNEQHRPFNSLYGILDHNVRDCSDLGSDHYRSGVYTIYPAGGAGFKVFCDMETDQGGWTVNICKIRLGSESVLALVNCIGKMIMQSAKYIR